MPPTSGPVPRPQWWWAWHDFKTAALTGAPVSPERLDELKEQGCPMDGLANWRPSETDRKLIRDMDSWLNNPPDDEAARQSLLNKILDKLSRPDAPWPTLQKLAAVYMSALPRRERNPNLAVPDAQQFGRTASELTIYIDESWPGSPKYASPEDKEIGVFGGLVWLGNEISEADLPRQKTHLREVGNPYVLRVAVKDVLECSKCLPFILKVHRPGTYAENDYLNLLNWSIQFLLGWVLSGVGRDLGEQPPRVAIRFVLEDFKNKFPLDVNFAQYFAGLIDGAAQTDPARFARWDLEEVVWSGKEREYVPYGDLMAYLPIRSAKRKVGDWAKYWEFPGFMNVSLDLVPLLERVEKVEQSGDVNAILDVIPLMADTNFGQAFLRNVGSVAGRSPNLQRKILEALDERYKAPNRNLDVLDQQVNAIREYVIRELPTGASLQLRLLWTAVAFHVANHSGNPDLAGPAAKRYEKLRAEAFPNERELVANLDCKLAIHYADRFEFAEAEAVLRRLIDDPAFPYIELWTRGVVQSSLGQICSMLGNYHEAEKNFLQAGREFSAAKFHDPEQQSRERRRTGTYRAINAIDAGWGNSILLTEKITGPLAEAGAKFGVSEESVFEHHLFLRCLLNFRPKTSEHSALLAAGREAYLQQKDDWKSGTHHPWELVEMYRAILLFEAQPQPDGVVSTKLAEAMELSASPKYGETLGFIQAMIGTVAYRLTGEAHFQMKAEEAMAGVQQRFGSVPAARAVVDSLRAFLDSETPVSAVEIMRVLPFNYH